MRRGLLAVAAAAPLALACGRRAPEAPAASAAASAGAESSVPASAPESAPADYPRLAICLPDWEKGGVRLKTVGEAMTVGLPLQRQRVDALLGDPEGPFPPGTRLLALYELPGGQWVADLSGEIRKVQGSAGERAAVSSLVETLALDQKDFKGLRILIDGQPADALGHLDLNEPFAATPGACREGA